jgi:hypothetical protein
MYERKAWTYGSQDSHAASRRHPEGGVSRTFGHAGLCAGQGIRVPQSRINDICSGKHGIMANIALRLGKFFNADPQWFTNIQAKHDLHTKGAS